MIPVVLGIGSNREWNKMSSLQLMENACCQLKVFLSDFKMSSVYKTKPMYYENQDDFYNMVVLGGVSEDISPQILLEKIHKIEESLGRNRSKEIRNGPRSIDIDIEFFGTMIVNEQDLQIPHPKLKERAFVLVPLLEILDENADFIKRGYLLDLLKNTGDSGIEKFFSTGNFLEKEA